MMPRRQPSCTSKKRADMDRDKNSAREYRNIQSEIKESCLQDYKDWVNRCVTEMEAANAVGNTRRVFAITNKLSKKPKQPPQNLSTDESGSLLKSAEEVAAVWERFLSGKFAATAEEANRPAMADIPADRAEGDTLTRKEFEAAVKKLSNNKAVGPDGVPAEAFKYSAKAKDILFLIIQQIWEQEKLSEEFGRARQIYNALQKQGGFTERPHKIPMYRPP